MELMPTHYCIALFIVYNWGNIGEYELVCTRISQWTEKDGPPKNIGKKANCGHSELYDYDLDEHLANSGAENILEFMQIKLAINLAKMIKLLETANLVELRKNKGNLLFKIIRLYVGDSECCKC